MVFRLGLNCAKALSASMATVFNKIHRLKNQEGWTWDHFLCEVDKLYPSGLDEKTLYSHFRHPHKKPNSQLTRIINQLHDQYFPDPFPEEINRLLRLYNNLIGCKRHQYVERDIQDLEFFLQQQFLRESPEDYLRIARINWLLGNISFDRIPSLRDSAVSDALDASKSTAIQHYQVSVSAIEQYNHCHEGSMVGPSYLYKARHNILACYLNAVPKAQRGQDKDVLQYLRESSYIENSKSTLEAEPFQWRIARNGLRFSSLIEDERNVSYFFEALVKTSKRFLDLDYEPLDAAAISKGSDFQWAIRHVLTHDYLGSF